MNFSKTLKYDVLTMPKQVEAKKDGVINPQITIQIDWNMGNLNALNTLRIGP